MDLGSGGALDVILAARKVGLQGRAIGVDMTRVCQPVSGSNVRRWLLTRSQSMLDLARRNAERAGASNASFVEGSITAIPLPDSTANCIISNCVVNLVPAAEKPLVFYEMFRLLASGGRVAISDILAKKDLPDELASDMALYIGCIAGASRIHEYEKYLRDAGFQGWRFILSKR